MFGAVKQMFQFSAAAVVAQNLLEQQCATGLFHIDPKALSNRLVALTFGEKPDLINGKKGPKPHKISMAAVALAQGMREFDRHSDEYMACFLSIGAILMEMEANGGSYPLTGKDAKFLELARREYFKHEADADFVGQETVTGWDVAASTDLELQNRKREIQERLEQLRK